MDTHAWICLDAEDKARILKGLAAGKVLAPPRLVDLEWSRRQLLPDATGARRPSRAADEMDLYTLEMLFEEMEDAGVKGLVLGGDGDPLGHRSIDSILKRIAKSSLRLCSLSTGGIPNDDRALELLAALRPRRLEWRLEAMDDAGYAGRLGAPGTRLHQTVENLRLFRSLLPPDSECRVVARLVLFPGDEPKIGRMVEAAAAMGADAVAFAASRRPADAMAAVERREAFVKGVRAALEADREGRIESLEAPHPVMECELRELRKILPGRLSGWEPPGGEGAPFRTACVMPWLGLAIGPNGAAHPCRPAFDRGEAPAGNIHALPLERLWKSRPLKAVRSASRGARWDGRCCSACPGGEASASLYAADHAFRQELDSLLRGGLERAVRFPDRLREREWSTVILPLRHLWPWKGEASPQVRVDGIPVGAAAEGNGKLSIRFRPDGLPKGFHLVEVVDRSGRLLKARLVEKTG